MSERLVFNRKLRYHDDPHHYSNWCDICGLYYCWHPECTEYRNDCRAIHKFIPRKSVKKVMEEWIDE